VLVAFALIGSTPVKMSVGNVKKVPPPATALSEPAMIATAKRRSALSGSSMTTGSGAGTVGGKVFASVIGDLV
jgi:hypothetical protein